MTDAATARFDRARRVHGYDHDEGRFVVSAVEFQDGTVAARDLEGGEVSIHDGLDTALDEGVTAVWEDGGSNGFSEAELDRSDASDAAKAVVAAVAEAEGVDPGRVMLVSLSAPCTARYFLAPPAIDEVLTDG